MALLLGVENRGKSRLLSIPCSSVAQNRQIFSTNANNFNEVSRLLKKFKLLRQCSTEFGSHTACTTDDVLLVSGAHLSEQYVIAGKS